MLLADEKIRVIHALAYHTSFNLTPANESRVVVVQLAPNQKNFDSVFFFISGHEPYLSPVLWDIFTCALTRVQADGVYTGLIPRGFIVKLIMPCRLCLVVVLHHPR